MFLYSFLLYCVPSSPWCCYCYFRRSQQFVLQVEAEEARQYAEENSIMFLETSAKTAANVNELFVQIARKLPKQAADAKPAQPQVWPKQESGRNWRCFRAR
mmetsp:Transcript_81192/g.218318  ORF Transcript_81192/g.218318 Transcript_81192/m.218318 type:complete len:101 (+) Transcript_81192:507-809(+)